VAAIALVALIGAGCANAPAETGSGGGEKPATEGSASTVPDSNATGETGGTADPATVQRPQKYPPEFSKCMRENGVEDFPDPTADGLILYYGDDPDMESASEKCDELQPGDRAREPGSG
jgi:hypothetical protein